MATLDHKNQDGTEKRAPSGSNSEDSEKVGGTMRSKTHEVLAIGPVASRATEAGPVVSRATGAGPGAPGPDKPPTPEELIDSLGLRSQYEERADHMVSLIHDGLFVFGKPIPSCERVMETFTKEMLELAATFQKPTLLLVPETSFAAKVKALNATKTMDGQKDCYVEGIYRQSDTGSETIAGWKAVIVDGAGDMKNHGAANGAGDLALTLAKRIAIRKSSRRKNSDGSDLERGMDRHMYAMLMLEAIRKGAPIDVVASGWRFTPLVGDPANSKSLAPYAGWNPELRRVFFSWVHPGGPNGGRFRSGVGGVVPP